MSVDWGTEDDVAMVQYDPVEGWIELAPEDPLAVLGAVSAQEAEEVTR